MRDGQRDDALLASLESLVVSTRERRRRASTLVGDDYSHLLATNPAQPADGLAFNAEKMQLTYFSGAQISQWSMVDQSLESREPWTMSALEVTPLVRRVVVDRAGLVSRVGLTVNVSHARLDDIRMKLIAPSGRAIELAFDKPSSAANDEVRINREQLSPLIGEALNGIWSLSLRDESTGVSGHLVGWNLSLNSQVVVENFERGLDIPDPAERASQNLWYSPDGRYAIARALQSDSARLWNLDSAEAARTIAVPANEQVLGLSANAEFLVTMTQDTVNMWRTATGRRSKVLEIGAAGADLILASDGEHLLVLGGVTSSASLETAVIEVLVGGGYEPAVPSLRSVGEVLGDPHAFRRLLPALLAVQAVAFAAVALLFLRFRVRGTRAAEAPARHMPRRTRRKRQARHECAVYSSRDNSESLQSAGPAGIGFTIPCNAESSTASNRSFDHS